MTAGLTVFIVVIVLDVVGLMVDATRDAWGIRTITSYAREYPWVGSSLLSLQAVDVHFGSGELTVVGLLLSSIIGALTMIFKLLMASKDQQLTDIKAERDNYKSVANDAVRLMGEAVNRQREATGLPRIAAMAPVQPEHQSPTTEAEETTAHQATLRAAVTAAALFMGVPGRSDPPDRNNRGQKPCDEKEAKQP